MGLLRVSVVGMDRPAECDQLMFAQATNGTGSALEAEAQDYQRDRRITRAGVAVLASSRSHDRGRSR
jgi:hypothetical protein